MRPSRLDRTLVRARRWVTGRWGVRSWGMRESPIGSVIESSDAEPGTVVRRVARFAVGGVLGGVLGATTAVLVTELIKRILAVVSRQETWVLLSVPLLGVALAVLVLHGYGCGEAVQTIAPKPTGRAYVLRRPMRWNTFPRDVARADLTADVVQSAGREERFPWHLTPVRAVAIVATVGLGAPMGTEAPAAHIGVASGSWLGQTRPVLRRFLRPAAIGGGAAAVSALMGIPLVGTAFMLELGRRRRVPLSAERVAAALIGGLVGWVFNHVFDLALIRLIVPMVPPADLGDAVAAALLIGALAGGITGLTGAAIYKARGWQAGTIVRLGVGAAAMLAVAATIAIVAAPSAAIGPGGGAIVWAETNDATWYALLAVALLRAMATVAAVAAGGCGGVFVPFLAIGDISGRVFAPAFGVPADLAGAAGAAAGIAGGYHLPVTAIMMVIGVGGPFPAMLTCLATVIVAAIAGVGADRLLGRALGRRARATPAAPDTGPGCETSAWPD
jgi:H+/Cl- antiporter ClcA